MCYCTVLTLNEIYLQCFSLSKRLLSLEEYVKTLENTHEEIKRKQEAVEKGSMTATSELQAEILALQSEVTSLSAR